MLGNTLCVCVHVSARLSMAVFVCVCVCVYIKLIDKSVFLWVGPVDRACHGDGNQVGPGDGLWELI